MAAEAEVLDGLGDAPQRAVDLLRVQVLAVVLQHAAANRDPKQSAGEKVSASRETVYDPGRKLWVGSALLLSSPDRSTDVSISRVLVHNCEEGKVV